MIKATDLPPIPDGHPYVHPSPPAPTWKYPMPTQPVISPPSIDLRDWFAGLAMQTLIKDLCEWAKDKSNPLSYEDALMAVANDAYAMADQMLKAREAK